MTNQFLNISFQGLENVVLDGIEGITIASLWKLLVIPNRLNILRCWNCSRITPEDKDLIKDEIKTNNLTLYWEWYPYADPDNYGYQEEEEDEEEESNEEDDT